MQRVVAVGCLLVLLVPATGLAAAPEFGLGVYQGSKIGLPSAYPSFMLWATPEILLGFGLSFSTIATNNFGFYSKFGYSPFKKGNLRLLFGAGFEVLEFQAVTHVNFGALGGADARLTDNFSVFADIYPFAISTNGDTEAIFFEGRVGAAWWFK